ncbi:MAG: sensory rhodopsin transducer [Anaerolineae bacterium]|nr:sensory rhodopsin transducer [Anaerolineae bacterium]
MRTHYLIDHNYIVDERRLFGEFGHLLAFNPGPRDATLAITLYFEDRDPVSFSMSAPAGQSTETNYARWPLEPGVRFAMKVESTEPVVCQATIGWNNTLNDYGPSARTKSPQGIRECAKSYMAITQLASEWYLPDGIVIDMADRIYVRESEWALILNPGDVPARVRLDLHYDTVVQHEVDVPPRRLRAIYMDDVARRNAHYGVHFVSDQPVAVQWLRTVKWYDRDELMCYWSVPCVPGPLA